MTIEEGAIEEGVPVGRPAAFALGRRLLRNFEYRFPEQHAEAGKPRSGYFNSRRRRAYFQFLCKRVYADLTDSRLVRHFDRLRRSENALLAFMISGFTVFGIALLWVEFQNGW